MAELESKIIVKAELRPCIVWGKNALFHRWSNVSDVIPPSILKGGHSGGVIAYTVGIVEFEDGTICEVRTADIRFIDHPHKQYTFDEREGRNEH